MRFSLLVYDRIRRQMVTPLTITAILLLSVGIVDYFTEILGSVWYFVWVVFAGVLALWFYYAVLMRRSSIRLNQKYMRLQGPVGGINISYARILTVTAVKMSRQYPFKKLPARDQRLLRPLYNVTAVLVELRSEPKSFRRRHFWFSRYLFGTTAVGLLLSVEDWMLLSSKIEEARAVYREQHGFSRHKDKRMRSLAADILDI